MSTKDLAIAVFITAIKDAISTKKYEGNRDKKEAIRFLTVRTPDFDFWCDMAGFEPDTKFEYFKDIETNRDKYIKLIKEYEARL